MGQLSRKPLFSWSADCRERSCWENCSIPVLAQAEGGSKSSWQKWESSLVTSPWLAYWSDEREPRVSISCSETKDGKLQGYSWPWHRPHRVTTNSIQSYGKEWIFAAIPKAYGKGNFLIVTVFWKYRFRWTPILSMTKSSKRDRELEWESDIWMPVSCISTSTISGPQSPCHKIRLSTK